MHFSRNTQEECIHAIQHHKVSYKYVHILCTKYKKSTKNFCAANAFYLELLCKVKMHVQFVFISCH